MEKKTVYTIAAPRPVGPYSQAVALGDTVYTAGQIGLDPKTGKLAGDDVQAQTRQVMSNLEAVLSEAGASFTNVVKTTIYLADMKDFPVVNEIYGAMFKDNPPARSTVQVAGLPLGALVEIDMIAGLPESSASF
ncbi:MAG: RidA family protein [Nitrospinae bacterium]|nr:RidA family protein [Nitrospinota bacterium]